MNRLTHSQYSKFFNKISIVLLAPFAPHIAEELWNELGHDTSVFAERWPEYDKDAMEDDEILDISKEFGAEIIRRPAELATDTTTTFDSIKHTIDHYPSLTTFETKFQEYFKELVFTINCFKKHPLSSEINQSVTAEEVKSTDYVGIIFWLSNKDKKEDDEWNIRKKINNKLTIIENEVYDKVLIIDNDIFEFLYNKNFKVGIVGTRAINERNNKRYK